MVENLSGCRFKADNNRRVHICRIHCVHTYLQKEGVATYVAMCKRAFSYMENEFIINIYNQICPLFCQHLKRQHGYKQPLWISICKIIKSGTHWPQAGSTPGFLKLFLCGRLYACVCPSPRLVKTSAMIWTSYDWLNKFYSFYMVTVVIIVNGCGLGIGTHCRH